MKKILVFSVITALLIFIMLALVASGNDLKVQFVSVVLVALLWICVPKRVWRSYYKTAERVWRSILNN